MVRCHLEGLLGVVLRLIVVTAVDGRVVCVEAGEAVIDGEALVRLVGVEGVIDQRRFLGF